MLYRLPFFLFSFAAIFSIIDFIQISKQGYTMSNLDAHQVAQRIDTVLDILVAGDYHSAINNLEILKAELLTQIADQQATQTGQPKSPWEI